jgi:hypothetical protein
MIEKTNDSPRSGFFRYPAGDLVSHWRQVVGIVMTLSDDESLLNEQVERNMEIVLDPAVQAQHLVGHNAVKPEDSHHFSFSVGHCNSRCVVRWW